MKHSAMRLFVNVVSIYWVMSVVPYTRFDGILTMAEMVIIGYIISCAISHMMTGGHKLAIIKHIGRVSEMSRKSQIINHYSAVYDVVIPLIWTEILFGIAVMSWMGYHGEYLMVLIYTIPMIVFLKMHYFKFMKMLFRLCLFKVDLLEMVKNKEKENV